MKVTILASALGCVLVAGFVDAAHHANPAAAHKRAASAALSSRQADEGDGDDFGPRRLEKRASCSRTNDCKGDLPSHAHHFCDTAAKRCTFKCDSGYVLNKTKDGCTKTSTGTVVSRATISCGQTADCTNAKAPIPANSHQLCDRKSLTCTWACNSGYTKSGSSCTKGLATAKLAGRAASASTTTRKTTTTTKRTSTTTTKRTSTTTVKTTSRALAATTSAPASTTATTSPSCAAKYTAATMIKGTGTLPKPTAYVTKSSTSQGLSLGGKAYRIAGVNIYWLCQDENVPPVGADTDKGRIREALAIAVAMGSNTIRLISCSTSVGSSYSLQPSLNTFNAAKWDIRDYAIYAAGQYGLRVILPLTDNYQYYTGGKYNYLAFRGVSQSNYGSQFYTNTQVIADFQNYVTTLLNHRNSYNGKTWATDPTIMAFESGNELGAYIGKEGYPPASWTKAIMGIVRQQSKALIIDGSDGFYNYSTKATSPGLGVSIVDIMTDHSYPRNIGLLKAEVPLAANAKKNFLIGEFDWTNNNGGDSLSSYLSYVASQSYMGTLVWSIQGHDAQCCNYVPHNDGYSIYYPNGPNSSSDKSNILPVVQHFYRTTGRSVPSALPGVACPQPVF